MVQCVLRQQEVFSRKPPQPKTVSFLIWRCSHQSLFHTHTIQPIAVAEKNARNVCAFSLNVMPQGKHLYSTKWEKSVFYMQEFWRQHHEPSLMPELELLFGYVTGMCVQCSWKWSTKDQAKWKINYETFLHTMNISTGAQMDRATEWMASKTARFHARMFFSLCFFVPTDSCLLHRRKDDNFN